MAANLSQPRPISNTFKVAALILAGAMGLSAAPAPKPTALSGHVLLVAFGGLRGDVLPRIKTPTLDSLRKVGAFSDRCMSVLPSRSGPTWTSLLTGQGPGSHGVQENDFKGWKPTRAPALPSLLRLSGYSGGFFAITHSQPMGRLLFDAHDWLQRENDEDVEGEALRLLEFENPGVLFVQFDAAESTGARFGYEAWSPLYRAAFADFDRRLGHLCATLRSRPAFNQENWLLVVTANHGGHGRKTGEDRDSDRRVFLLLASNRIPAGSDLGDTFQVDIVPTLLAHLSLTAPDTLKLTGSVRGVLSSAPVMDGDVSKLGKAAIASPEGRPSMRYSRGASLRMAR